MGFLLRVHSLFLFCILALSLFQSLVLAQSQDLRSCLISAVSNDKNRAKFPDSLAYAANDVRRYNLYYDIIPTAVTYPTSASEVGAVVKCAAKFEVKVQARSGGHSFADYCLGGVSGQVVVDTKNLNQLSYNPADQTAHIGPGNHLQDVNQFLLAYGRKMPHGDAFHVGVGGHYTIGGLGRISRQFGAATDQILRAEVVVANGTVVHASDTEHPDLFFAIRGAGASFGIVTDFYVKTSPAPGNAVAYTYNVTFGSTELEATAYKAWQKLISDPNLSWKFSSQFVVLPIGSVINGFFFGTPSEFSTLNLQGQLFGLNNSGISVSAVSGVVAVGNELANLALDLFDNVPAHFYSKSLPFTQQTLMTDAAIDEMFSYLRGTQLSVDLLGIIWFIIFDLEGGAINQVPAGKTAFAFRDTVYYLQSYAADLTGWWNAQARGFLDGVNSIIQKHDSRVTGAYPGYVDPYLTNGPQQYWGPNLPRLQQIKKRLDPGNVFSYPQSVPLS